MACVRHYERHDQVHQSTPNVTTHRYTLTYLKNDVCSSDFLLGGSSMHFDEYNKVFVPEEVYDNILESIRVANPRLALDKSGREMKIEFHPFFDESINKRLTPRFLQEEWLPDDRSQTIGSDLGNMKDFMEHVKQSIVCTNIANLRLRRDEKATETRATSLANGITMSTIYEKDRSWKISWLLDMSWLIIAEHELEHPKQTHHQM